MGDGLSRGQGEVLPSGADEERAVVLLAVLIIGLVITAVLYPFARWRGAVLHRRGEPTWWSLKLHSGDREAALAEDRSRHQARQARRARWGRRGRSA